MAALSALTDIKDGIKARLKTITAIREVYLQPMDTQSQIELPVVELITDSVEYPVAIGGAHFRGTIRARLFVNAIGAQEAYGALDEFLDPSGTNSILAAIEGDDTVGGKADQVVVIRAEGIGGEELNGQRIYSVDFLMDFVKTA